MAGMIPVELQARIRQLLEYAAANGIVPGGNNPIVAANPIVHGAAAGGKVLVIFVNGEVASRASIHVPHGITLHEVRGRIYHTLGLANVNDQHGMEIRADFHNAGGANDSVPVADEGVWGFIFSNTIAPRINLHVNIEAPNA